MVIRRIAIGALIIIAACHAVTVRPRDPVRLPADAGESAPPDAAVEDVAVDDDGGPPIRALRTDPMDSHRTTREDLLALFEVKAPAASAFLDDTFGPESQRKVNQGNKAIARHLISEEKCVEGLRQNNIVIQTPEQRTKCGDFENMVPVWEKGKDPTYCIDVFEFPNKTCELPMIWASPTTAKRVCELQGKRLCSDREWNLACRADPDGGPDQRYAYGDKLDLQVCNTNLAHRTACNPRGPTTAWGTCSTDTEPSGAFPKCRSRFGVFDQHGNVAEIMTRREGEQVVTQLKGSAWFYVELAREPGQPAPNNREGAYPDHCNFDPRWHVEPIDQAGHTNYHLGFRCCRSIE